MLCLRVEDTRDVAGVIGGVANVDTGVGAVLPLVFVTVAVLKGFFEDVGWAAKNLEILWSDVWWFVGEEGIWAILCAFANSSVMDTYGVLDCEGPEVDGDDVRPLSHSVEKHCAGSRGYHADVRFHGPILVVGADAAKGLRLAVGGASCFKIVGGEDSIVSICLLYTSPSPRDLSTSRMPSSA